MNLQLAPALRTTLRVALLTLVVASVGAWARRTLQGEPDPGHGSARTPSAARSLPADGVAVVNFHGFLRCETCLRIGELSRAVTERDYAAQLAAGRVTWLDIDHDEALNAHFRDDYDIFASTVVVVSRRAGLDVGWERIDEVWELYDDEPAFRARLAVAIDRRLAELAP
jgi:hypothetical protein